MKEYFSYKMQLGCGLSKVTLKGSLDDWKQLIQKAHGLYDFKQKILWLIEEALQAE